MCTYPVEARFSPIRQPRMHLPASGVALVQLRAYTEGLSTPTNGASRYRSA
jgi:hypothetical protein